MDKKTVLILMMILYGCSYDKSANCEFSNDIYNIRISLLSRNNHLESIGVRTSINGDVFVFDHEGFDYYLNLYKEYYQNVYEEDGNIVIDEQYNDMYSEDINLLTDVSLRNDEYFAFNATVDSLIEEGYICTESMLK